MQQTHREIQKVPLIKLIKIKGENTNSNTSCIHNIHFLIKTYLISDYTTVKSMTYKMNLQMRYSRFLMICLTFAEESSLDKANLHKKKKNSKLKYKREKCLSLKSAKVFPTNNTNTLMKI